MGTIQFNKLLSDDITSIVDLQPDGWPDITEAFRFYVSAEFCNPVKVVSDDRIVGVGVSIKYENSAWLAHIIVHQNYRNKGTGLALVEHLLSDLSYESIPAVLLIATAMGEPVYKKAGFRVVTDYVFFKRDQAWSGNNDMRYIIPYRKAYYPEIINMDRMITGENREPLIKQYLDDSFIYLDHDGIQGFYVPGLGEGLILAWNETAGTSLMRLKYEKADKAVIPADNLTGIDFLKKHGFTVSDSTGKRMIRGRDIAWKPECIFSRIGGNFG